MHGSIRFDYYFCCSTASVIKYSMCCLLQSGNKTCIGEKINQRNQSISTSFFHNSRINCTNTIKGSITRKPKEILMFISKHQLHSVQATKFTATQKNNNFSRTPLATVPFQPWLVGGFSIRTQLSCKFS